ncbi:MAG TPA: M20/M25/M40 family metallo-hydrolase [Thermoanaerobaculia bacterium]|jgi:acetylornithine deacetylase/succinyl-diaminopimelate desuccinylase-like protein
MMTSSILGLFLQLAAGPAAVPPPPTPNFDAATAEAVPILQEYLRIDTTNPPGNERAAADFFQRIFEREGIESRVYDLGGGRANVLARLPGRGGKRPIVLLNHMDVVPADSARWTVPPFSGEIRDGYVWGRGATDMKGTAVCQLMTMLLLKRSGAPLERDVLFLGTADEEEGGADGVQAMVDRYRADLRDAEFVLTEGNTLSVEEGKTVSWDVDVTEKSALWLRVIATGKAGHASIPEPDGAVARLVRGLSRILAWEPPVRLIPAVEAYFRQLSTSSSETGDLRRALADPRRALRDPKLRSVLLADPFRAACLRATISVTGLKGSDKTNVIPGEASASLDCRLLPGDDPQAFVAALAKAAGDPSLRFEPQGALSRATESSIDTELFRAIVRARDRFEPGVPVLTPPLTSSTDATLLRQIGMVVYGFEPFHLSEDDDRSHGDDERLSLANVRFGLEVTYAVVSDVAGAR